MTSSANISYAPTDGLSYDPNESIYWDKQALAKEINRTFEICHGCRLCFKYCSVFPDLFNLIDNKYDGNVNDITFDETDALMGACFHCKLCEVNCPYTVRDKHDFLLDFPKLVNRHQAIRFKEKGAKFRDKILASIKIAGKLSRLSFGVVNLLNKSKAHRWFMELLLGIHRKKMLPNFSRTTFSKWAEKNNKYGKIEDNSEAVLFPTCYVDNNDPQVGIDTLKVMEKNEVKITCTKGLECCGAPFWEYGDLKTLKKLARKNILTLYKYVEQGSKIVVLSPTCSMMFKNEYPTLVDEDIRDKSRAISKNIFEPSDYLWSLREDKTFSKMISSHSGDVAYHIPCHTRTLAKGFSSRDLIRKISGKKVNSVLKCCGHDGSHAVKKETYQESIKVGKQSFNEMNSKNCNVWVTDCPLAAIQFKQHAGKKPMHPMSYLAEGYKEDGFKDIE